MIAHTTNTLILIVCKYCKFDFVTYTDFEMELHHSLTHGIRSDSRIRDVINDGKRIGGMLGDGE
jgi:hypothetical protein